MPSEYAFDRRRDGADSLARYSYAAGFFLYWFIYWLAMAALGLATEAMVTLLTPRFISYFLLALVRILWDTNLLKR